MPKNKPFVLRCGFATRDGHECGRSPRVTVIRPLMPPTPACKKCLRRHVQWAEKGRADKSYKVMPIKWLPSAPRRQFIEVGGGR